jgi:hypothetical protein
MMTLPSKQNSEQTALHIASNLDINDQMAGIYSNVQSSATEARQQFSTCYNQALTMSDQHTTALKAGFINLEKTTATLQDQVQMTAESLQNSMTDQFTKSRDYTRLLNSGIQELLHELRFSARSARQNNLGSQLQDHIDRLYALSNESTKDINIDSAEAQLITEDLLTILQALLDEISLPNPCEIIHKRKMGVIDDDEAAEVEVGIQQRRAFKRMRGLLESSQGVQIRGSSRFFSPFIIIACAN